MRLSTVVSGYPQHWEADVVGRDGSLIQIRPIAPTDRQALQDFHVNQSEQSRYFRFFAPLPQLSERDLDRFTQVDHVNRVALVAVAQDRILGVGRYDRIDESGTAEVAFNVSDMEQGRGLGSVLLEHLAAAARERGISQFVADVLPHNVKMLRVFRDAGYHISQEIDDDVMTVEFAIDPTMRQLEVLAEREHRSEARAMRFLYHPQRVLALFGGQEGPIFHHAIAPRLPQDVTVLSAPDQLVQLQTAADGDPSSSPFELALIALDPQEFISALPTLSSLGVRMVVLFSDGFGEGEDKVPHRILRKELRKHHVRLVGPRSYGVVVHHLQGKQIVATAQRSWDHPPQISEGQMPAGDPSVAVFAQSAAGARTLVGQLHQAGLALHSLISAGHRLDISGNDAMQYLATDPDIRVVAMGFESIGNPRKFNRIARRLSAHVPVVATLLGESGQVLPMSSPEAGRPSRRRALEQLMAQAGVFLAQSTAEQTQWVMALSTGRIPTSARVHLFTNSRTQVALAHEVAAKNSASHPIALSSTCLNPMVDEDTLLSALDATMASGEWDVLIISYGAFAQDLTPQLVSHVNQVMNSDERLVIMVDDVASSMVNAQLSTIAGLVPALKAAQVAIEYGTRTDEEDDYPIPQGIQRVQARTILDEFLADAGLEEGSSVIAPREVMNAVLKAYGLYVLPTVRVHSLAEAISGAEEVGWPVTLKSVDPVVRHRLDVGGVILNIDDAAEMSHAWEDLHAQLAAIGRTEIACDVQPMVEAGVACVLQGEEDPRYGPIISFGLGGDASQLLEDIAYRVPPLRTRDVQEIVHSVRAAVRLKGDQGLPPANLESLYDVIARISLLKEDLAQIQSIELHPVLCGPRNSSILDAKMVLMASTRGDLVRRSLPT